jgi:hypothetical protein
MIRLLFGYLTTHYRLQKFYNLEWKITVNDELGTMWLEEMVAFLKVLSKQLAGTSRLN